ncbi:MAG: U32 family peptidase C-terminal domain-containing protein, partial [Erysipelotrichaceae bacterium]|nr:U32 family peptidase C-terminal domain-containing protein [Erysipelotrichaceae bacterium]
IICASPAILELCHENASKLEVHVSTQQTTLNSAALAYWEGKKADRVVLGREMSLDQVRLLQKETDMPIELFIHGGMCASYSGRCVISNLLTNRDANRGGCAQSCRWNYHLYHSRELLDREDALFSLGSKDMCTADCLDRILELHPASLKIEGRMKTAFYIGCVVKGYRYMIDCWQQQGYLTEEHKQTGMRLIDLASNRDSFHGFYEGVPGREGQLYNAVSTASQVFLANVLSCDENGEAVIEVRNNFHPGDRLGVLRPSGAAEEFDCEKLTDMEGNDISVANKPMQQLHIKLPCKADRYSFIYAAGGAV